VEYFFEAGHKLQKEASRAMDDISKNARLRTAYRYNGHSFVDKKGVRPVQAADILAWHLSTQLRRVAEGKMSVRADFRELAYTSLEHQFLIPNRNQFAEFANALSRWAGDNPVVTGSFGQNAFLSVKDTAQRGPVRKKNLSD
jgi:hypothetical protein